MVKRQVLKRQVVVDFITKCFGISVSCRRGRMHGVRCIEDLDLSGHAVEFPTPPRTSNDLIGLLFRLCRQSNEGTTALLATSGTQKGAKKKFKKQKSASSHFGSSHFTRDDTFERKPPAVMVDPMGEITVGEGEK